MNEDESCKSNRPLLHLCGRICDRVNSLQENTSLPWKIHQAILRWRYKLSQDHQYRIASKAYIIFLFIYFNFIYF